MNICLQQFDEQTNYARNDKHFSAAPNATIHEDELERSTFTGTRTRARTVQTSSETNARVYTTAKFKTSATTYHLEMTPILEMIQAMQTLL